MCDFIDKGIIWQFQKEAVSSLFLCVHVIYMDIFCLCKWLICFPELLLFLIVLYSSVLKANTQENTSWVIKNRALVLQNHSFGDLRNPLDIPKGLGKHMDIFQVEILVFA